MATRIGLVVSLKYAPGHLTSVTAFDSQSHSVLQMPNTLLLSRRYRWMLSKEQADRSFFCGTSDSSLSMVLDSLAFLLFGWLTFLRKFWGTNVALAYFVNPHPLNPVVALLLKVKDPGCRVLIHLHEPEPDTDSRSWIRRAYERAIDLVQVLSLKISDDIIVSSEIARSVLKGRDLISDSKVHLVPLLFDDMKLECQNSRRFVTYVGHVSRRRGIDTFLACAAQCHAQSLDIDFQIISKDDLEPFLAEIPPEVRQKLKIVNKPDISNQEIADALSQSIACCVIYKSKMMQSGVVPVALRSGTPVIVTRVGGLSEFLEEGKNMISLVPAAGAAELCEAVLNVRREFDRMSSYSRETFERVFHEKNWARYFRWLGSANEALSTLPSTE